MTQMQVTALDSIKAQEHAEAGYYSVFLKDYNIKAELTSTERVGYQRFTYPKTDEAHVILDLGHKQGESGDVTNTFAQIVKGNEIEGYIETYPEYVKFCDPEKRVKMYFVAKLNKEPLKMGSFIDAIQQENSIETKGINNGLYLTFSMEQDELLEIQTGLSYTSIQNARLNLKAESIKKTFDAVQEESKKIWNKKLNNIVVEGGEKEDRIKFYTGALPCIIRSWTIE